MMEWSENLGLCQSYGKVATRGLIAHKQFHMRVKRECKRDGAHLRVFLRMMWSSVNLTSKFRQSGFIESSSFMCGFDSSSYAFMLKVYFSLLCTVSRGQSFRTLWRPWDFLEYHDHSRGGINVWLEGQISHNGD